MAVLQISGMLNQYSPEVHHVPGHQGTVLSKQRSLSSGANVLTKAKPKIRAWNASYNSNTKAKAEVF